MRISQFLCLLAVSLGVVREATAQAVSGNLLGKITDSSGSVIAGADVTATEARTGVSRKLATKGEGIYSIPYLFARNLSRGGGKPGFKKFVSDNAEPRVGAVLRIDGVLEIGAVTDTVEVMAQSPLLQTDTAEVSRTFIPRTITELPLVNRSFQGLAGILPGITPPSEDSLTLEDPQGTTIFRWLGKWLALADLPDSASPPREG